MKIIILLINILISRILVNLPIDKDFLKEIKFVNDNIKILKNSEKNLIDSINSIIIKKKNGTYKNKNLKNDTEKIFEMINYLDQFITIFYDKNNEIINTIKIYLKNKEYKRNIIILNANLYAIKNTEFINKKKAKFEKIIKNLNKKNILKKMKKRSFFLKLWKWFSC